MPGRRRKTREGGVRPRLCGVHEIPGGEVGVLLGDLAVAMWVSADKGASEVLQELEQQQQEEMQAALAVA